MRTGLHLSSTEDAYYLQVSLLCIPSSYPLPSPPSPPRVCGHEEEDLRARKSCTAHPRTWYLQDLETCAECGANCLKMQEYSKMDWE